MILTNTVLDILPPETGISPYTETTVQPCNTALLGCTPDHSHSEIYVLLSVILGILCLLVFLQIKAALTES